MIRWFWSGCVAWVSWLGVLAGLQGIAKAAAGEPVRYAQSSSFADSVVTFNEVLYHPVDEQNGVEWIEFHNQHTVMEDLSDWVLEGGVDYRFPKGTTIAGGGYILVASDPQRFRQATGREALGPLTGRLSDGGERVVLRNLHGRLMDVLEYHDATPWPVGADGSGASLAKRIGASPSSPPENWQASRQIGGTPGAENFPVSSSAPVVQMDLLISGKDPIRWKPPAAAEAGLGWEGPGWGDDTWFAGTNGLGYVTAVGTTIPDSSRYYRLEGTASDASGNGFHGILQGGPRPAATTAPVVGSTQALEMDGVDDVVRIPDPGSVPAYTLSLWVRPAVVRPASLVVRTDDAGPMVSYSHQLRVTAAGVVEHFTYDGTGKVVTGTTVLEAGRWYHVVATGESGGVARLFVNGVQEGTPVSLGSLWDGGARWFLGSAAQGFSQTFQGGMDEFGIWDRVLDLESIRLLAGGGVPPLSGAAGGGWGAWLQTEVGSMIRGRHSGVWIRHRFDAPSRSGYDALSLVARYDDGWVAWLNGVEVARRNAPAELAWDSTAMSARAEGESEVPVAVDLSAHSDLLRPAGNVLAVQVLNVTREDGDLGWQAELTGRRRAPTAGGESSLVFSEVAGGDAPGFFCELGHGGVTPESLGGLRIRSSAGGEYRFAAEDLVPGGYRVIRSEDLGFGVRPGDRLFLLGSDGTELLDAVEVGSWGRARETMRADQPFWRPAEATPGEVNRIERRTEIVLNEMLYHAPPVYARRGTPEETRAFAESDEEWVELYNRSNRTMDLSGWRLGGDVTWTFPQATVLAPGAYLVVARDAQQVRAKHPGIRVMGDWSGRLGGRGGRVALLDDLGNLADEVGYFDDAPWPARADGGGSSLELRDPHADNAVAGAWAASDERSRSGWRTYRYRARAVTPVKGPSLNGFHEFRMGLLADGEVLVDDLSVVEDPEGLGRSLIQNGTFEDARAWRLLGNHGHSQVIEDPDQPGNQVLRLVATDARGYMNNHLETTLKAGTSIVPVVTGRTYEVSFRAKWIGGSPLLHTELYYNKVARTTVLDMPDRHGTPGSRNTAWVTNAGPTFAELAHTPLVPKPGETVTVQARASDPDGVARLNLLSSVNGGAWQSRPMVPLGGGLYSALLPPQSLDAVVQFYVEGVDALGARGWMPAGGPDSRALYRVDTRVPRAPRKAFRFILTSADGRRLDAVTNMMSDDRVGATVVWDDREVFYDCGLHLHGSMFSRANLDATPYNLKFPADQRFRGVHRTVQVNRGTLEEILAKHVQVQAGIPGMYEDLVDLFSHRRGNAGAARLSLAHYNDIYLGSQFERGTEGMLYNMEGIRVLTTTHNGSPEGIKLGQPVGWVGDYDVMNLGDDPEQYRFSTTLRNNRARNDHAPYIAMAKAFSLTGTALEQAVPRVIDVDEWMRYYAVLTLFEIGDTYTLGNPHNIGFYARPSDGRLLALPYDWDFFFANGDNSPLWGNQNLGRIIARPVFTRVLYGHLHDLINGVFTTEYLAPFVSHFGQVAGQNYSGYLNRIRARAQYVRSRLPAVVPFEITTQGGADFSVATPEVTLEGRGWIDVHRVQVNGGAPMALTWLDGSRWRATLPLASATNRIVFEAFNWQGTRVGGDAITVITSQVDDVQRRTLRITELMYHPLDATQAEAAAGWLGEDFEFVEVGNLGSESVSLAGVRLEGAVTFAWPLSDAGSLAPGARVVVVKNRDAFTLRYGSGIRVAGDYTGSLNNAGERLWLVDARGLGIHDVQYDDEDPWPTAADGGGYSLEWAGAGAAGGPTGGWALGLLGGSPGQGEPLPAERLILSAKVEGDRLRLRALGRSGLGYQLQSWETTAGGPWVDIGVPQRPAESGALEWLVRTDGLGRYYRVRLE